MNGKCDSFFKCLADESRIAILNILERSDSYVELIAAKLELSPGTVCYHLKKMESAGIVRCSRTQFYVIYSLNRQIFDKPLSELLFAGDQTINKEAAYRQKVLDSFFFKRTPCFASFPTEKTGDRFGENRKIV